MDDYGGQTAKNSLYFPPDGPSTEVERCIHLTGYQSELWIRIGWKTASLLSLSLSFLTSSSRSFTGASSLRSSIHERKIANVRTP